MEKKEKSEPSDQHSYEDLAMKTVAQYFGEELLPYMGVEGKIKYIAPTESVHLEVRNLYQDFNYVVEDGSWLHLEFESDSIKIEDLRRFREYEATTSRTHKVEVNTCVICSTKVKKPLTELRSRMNTYRIRVIRLKDKDADRIFEKLFRKQREGIPLKKKELVQAVMYAFAVKFLTKKELSEVMDVLKRTILEEMLW